MTSVPPGLPMLDHGDIYYATRECISSFESCLSVKYLMKERWAENRLADLNLWATGTGALARPEYSLDRRLQFQSKAQLVLLNLLLTLDEFIKSCHMLALNENDFSKVESDGAAVSLVKDTLKRANLSDDLELAPSSASWFAALVSSTGTSSNTLTDTNIEDQPDERDFESTLKKAMKDIDDLLDQIIILDFAIRKSGTAKDGSGALYAKVESSAIVIRGW